MNDILEILKNARQRKIFLNKKEFEDLLIQIQVADKGLKLDWDDGAGEEWARFSNLTNGIVCMINAKIGIAFVREKYKIKKIQKIIENLEVVFVEDYYSDIWSIDISKLEKEIPEICWHASQEAVDVTCFSLDDLYFATI